MTQKHSCARIVAAIAKGAHDTLAIADAASVPLKTAQNALNGLREAGIVEAHGYACGEIGRPRLQWRIA